MAADDNTPTCVSFFMDSCSQKRMTVSPATPNLSGTATSMESAASYATAPCAILLAGGCRRRGDLFRWLLRLRCRLRIPAADGEQREKGEAPHPGFLPKQTERDAGGPPYPRTSGESSP